MSANPTDYSASLALIARARRELDQLEDILRHSGGMRQVYYMGFLDSVVNEAENAKCAAIAASIPKQSA